MENKVGRNAPCPCGSGEKYKKCCIDRPIGAAVKLVEKKDSTRWTIELMNFAEFDKALGRDVLAGFCRCFVQADRLTSLISFAHVSEGRYGRDSVAFARDLHTMVWFTIGTLRELAHAIRDLRAALAKRGILDAKSDVWLRLREVEQRWDRDDFFRQTRDKGAFHVDSDVIAQGLAVIVGEKRDVELSRGEGEKAVTSSLTLGLDALHNGLGWDMEQYGAFLQKVSEDQGIANEIQLAFTQAAESVGITFGE